ncbi:MAG: hypothetical protein WCP26_02160 [Actinomycetes bacterium]
MTDSSDDRGMGTDEPATANRSTRRTRRLAIVGALALVLVAGAVLVGVKTTGARSGALSSTNATVTCAFVERPVQGEPPPFRQKYDRVNLTVIPNAALNGVVLTLHLRWGTANLPIGDPDRLTTTTDNLGAANSVAITYADSYDDNFNYWVSWTTAGVAYESAHGTACS